MQFWAIRLSDIKIYIRYETISWTLPHSIGFQVPSTIKEHIFSYSQLMIKPLNHLHWMRNYSTLNSPLIIFRLFPFVHSFLKTLAFCWTLVHTCAVIKHIAIFHPEKTNSGACHSLPLRRCFDNLLCACACCDLWMSLHKKLCCLLMLM